MFLNRAVQESVFYSEQGIKMTLRFARIFVLVVFATALAGQVHAQSDQGLSSRVFGQGQPASVGELPPGQLKRKLEALPPQARGKALKWLQDFSFPEADVVTLDVDDEGNISYVDSLVVEENAAADPVSGPEAEAAPVSTLDDAFALHSRPGAPNTVFIDFDGHEITATAWNNSSGRPATYYAKPYDLDGSPGTFNSTERGRIVDIWHRVSEDLAPFNIDVTTEDPGSFDRYTGHILVTHTVDELGADMPSNGGGGVAYVGVFGNSNYHTYYSPALVYFDHLGSGGETYIAEASSHEFGHNLGLSHDGTTSGTTYYAGHGSGLVSWAPIMGNSYNKNITEWSRGEYTGANQSQDDLAIIDLELGYAGDDHGDSLVTATDLDVAGDGSVVSSNPEHDPHNYLPENKGVIDDSGDVDVFSFATGSGTIDLSITPSWDAFYRASSRRGSNLDISAELRDVNNVLLASSDPTNDTSAAINISVSNGAYYLFVTGVGNATTPYSDYDSLGQYFINGSVPPASVDEMAPEPNPMGFDSPPAVLSHDSISMTALTATDNVSLVEYRFNCLAGGQGCSGSGWQTGTAYTASGLAASTSYTFNVEARDQSDNYTVPSSSASATTAAPPPPPLAPSGLSANGASETSIDLVWTDNASTETGFRVERSAAGAGSFSVIANLGVDVQSYTDNGREASTTYDYRVAAVNDFGVSDYSAASGTTDDPPAFVDYESSSETPVAGSVSSTHMATHSSDGAAEAITERESGGKPQNRHTYMEHRWNFNISSGATVTVYAQAWKSGSNLSETFNLEYSLNNGSSFLPLMNISSSSDSNVQTANISDTSGGAIILRVKDTQQASGNRDKSTFHVDHLFIRVGNGTGEPPAGDPPAAPVGMTATAVSTSAIDLTWTGGSDDEDGFKVERSLNGSSNWVVIANLGAGMEAHGDAGLDAATQHFYRVSAYNDNGSSGFESADATTQGGEQPWVVLSASGYKSKGKHGVNLSWPAAVTVDVYRDSSLVKSAVTGGSFDDFTGQKGGATYEHKVCESGGDTNCSNVTTTIF